MQEMVNRINKRAIIISRLEKIIEDSVYYRNFSSEMNDEKKIIIGNYDQDFGQGKIE
jgi:hypothetical protein